MVGSTGTIRTMRLLRNKRTSEAGTNTTIINTTNNEASATAAADKSSAVGTNKTVGKTNATANSNSSSMEIKNSKPEHLQLQQRPHQPIQRHNASITSTGSSRSSGSSASSASSSSYATSRSSMSSTASGSQRDPHHNNHHHHNHHHHHHHHRSLSMRDTYLDLPWDEANGPEHDILQPAIAYRQSPASVWVFPPLPPQPNLYNCNNSQDALIQFEKAGLKGFRKQFSGRFKRFVLRKPAEPAPAIPPELKCQLKSIYVY